MDKLKLSRSAHNIEGQPMFKVLDKVQELERKGKHIIHFEIGDPDLPTPQHIVEAACNSLKRQETHYTSSMGIYDMRVAAAEATEHSRGFRPDINQVLVTPGANSIIYLTAQCVANPGSDMIIPDPGFPTYYSVAKFCGIRPIRLKLRESNEFRMDPDEVNEEITDKTKLIIINSPSNPTGAVMTKKELDEIYKIARDNGAYLLSDEVYARMIYDDDVKFYSPSINDKCKENTIVVNGFSKSFSMTGWRLGVAIGPENLIEKMGLLVQTIVSCVPEFVQRAGIAAINGDQKPAKQMVDTYRKRRDVLVDGLNALHGIKCIKNKGAFYVFPNIDRTGFSSEGFARYMLEEAGVALLPGNNFGKFGEGYVRLSYATNIENIKEGLERMRGVL